MTERLVVVGASAGGVEALARLIGRLPADFPAPVVVVLHVPPHGRSALPQIIERAGRLPARHATDGEPLEPGVVHVAPNDCHVLVADGRLEVVRGPRENGHRPAIDALFRSAAASYGARAIGVVLTGTLDDGTAGALTISRRGGTVVVQDPAEATFGDMPRHVIEEDHPRAVLPLAEIASYLVELVTQPGGEESVPSDTTAPFSCPDCGGVLAEARDDQVPRFRCRVGHAYTAAALLRSEEGAIEQALSTALRALEERADLSMRLARRFRRSELTRRADRAEGEAEHDLRQAEVVRRLLKHADALAKTP